MFVVTWLSFFLMLGIFSFVKGVQLSQAFVSRCTSSIWFLFCFVFVFVLLLFLGFCVCFCFCLFVCLFVFFLRCGWIVVFNLLSSLHVIATLFYQLSYTTGSSLHPFWSVVMALYINGSAKLSDLVYLPERALTFQFSQLNLALLVPSFCAYL